MVTVHVAIHTDRVLHCPVPVSGTCVWAGVAPPPTLTFSEAVLVVAVAGRNVVLIVQLAPTARVDGKGLKGLAPQVLVCVNRFAPVPVMEILVSGRGTVPVFVTVTVCGALVVLIVWLANATEAGETE